ncbi:chromate transporter [Paenibacillus pinihumi]|uniref:chromate transporter n=1 Tax=Paenibacillus pinihumi TaxID=669462 RepID=UPI000401F2E9|nr:chromate transporter [Paenibacillus pinihumi]
MRQQEKQNLWLLFISFLKIGPMTFGGGYAVLAVMEREVSERRKWLQASEAADVFSIAGSVPGAVAINSAMLIGYRVAGLFGAIAALAGILLPTFAIIIALSAVYLIFRDQPKVEAAFLSIRATVVALVVYAAYRIGRTAAVDFPAILIIILTVGLLYLGRGVIHPALLIAGGVAAGIWIVRIRKRSGKEIPPKKEEPVYDYMI